MRTLSIAAVAALLLATPLAGQARPTPAQAQAMLQARPELAAQLRQRILSSGMTPDQIRARLRAEGYPETLLDSYMGRGGAAAGTPSADVFDAVGALGLADDDDLAELMALGRMSPVDTRAGTARSARPSLDTIPADSGMVIFGLSLFRESSSLFLPNLDGPVDAGYRLGPGDQLVLILTGDVEAAHSLDVTREGFIVIPQVGQLSVANLTLRELEDLLFARLARAYSGIRRGAGATTQFSISVAKLRSNQVFVTGDVVAPGSYRVTSAGSALTALYAAGGPSEHGSLRRIEVRRGGRVVSTLDAYDYLLRGDASHDVRLQQGDIVFVPVHGPRVRMVGAVTRPATYEAKEGESVADLIAAAGGLRSTAAGRRLAIERVLPRDDRTVGRERALIEVSFGADGAVPAVRIEDGDIVRVPLVADRVRSQVVVKGHVWSAGPQGFVPGLTLTEALRRAGGAKPDAYIGTVHVSRLLADSSRIQLRASLVDTTGAMAEPFALQDDDEVTIYSRTNFRTAQYVVISGAVRNGGRFPWRAGMTLRDLVLFAGGLEENAFVKEAEIARRPAGLSEGVTARTLRVAIDSSYVIDAGVRAPVAADVELQSHDNVLIFRDPEWREPRTVVVTGEVQFPGRYTLTSRAERLSQLVGRAGGLTAEGDADGAFFSRLTDTATTMLARATERRRSLTGQATALDAPEIKTAADSAQSAADAMGRRLRVGLDLATAIRRPSRSDDVILENGDSLHIPKRRQIVEVRGAVNAPTALTHAGRRLGYYVDAAGGTTERAQGRRAYVIQPNGKIQSQRRFLGIVVASPTPRPGAVVVVPERSSMPQQGNLLANVTIVTQLLATLSAIVALSR